MSDSKKLSEAVLLVGNGWVDLTTGEFTQSQAVRNILATEYDPSAMCNTVCDWLSEPCTTFFRP